MDRNLIHAYRRLGFPVYLRSSRTGRAWVLCRTHERLYAEGVTPDTGGLTHRQVEWHLRNKPENFSIIQPDNNP